jgi:hypothetical protein
VIAKKLIWAFLLTMPLSAALAQTNEQAPGNSPQNTPLTTGTSDFVGAGWTHPNDWNFVMGPTSNPAAMVMVMTRRVPGGGVGFSCRRAGGIDEAVFLIDGVGVLAHSTMTGSLRVGNTSGPVQLTPIPPPPGESDSSLRVNGRNASADILAAMAREGANAPVVLEIPQLSRSFTITGPEETGLAEVASQVCRGWADGAR